MRVADERYSTRMILPVRLNGILIMVQTPSYNEIGPDSALTCTSRPGKAARNVVSMNYYVGMIETYSPKVYLTGLAGICDRLLFEPQSLIMMISSSSSIEIDDSHELLPFWTAGAGCASASREYRCRTTPP